MENTVTVNLLLHNCRSILSCPVSQLAKLWKETSSQAYTVWFHSIQTYCVKPDFFRIGLDSILNIPILSELNKIINSTQWYAGTNTRTQAEEWCSSTIGSLWIINGSSCGEKLYFYTGVLANFVFLPQTSTFCQYLLILIHIRFQAFEQHERGPGFWCLN